MTVLLHVLGCLAVWTVVSCAMGLFIGAGIRRGGSTRCRLINPETDLAEFEAILRGEKREPVDA
jgi:hypothetical protein